MNEELMRKMATEYAKRFTGTFYSWGGDDPLGGFDCSGFCCEILQSVGAIERGADLTASMLFERFKDKFSVEAREGCLVFYGAIDDPQRIIHVEYCLNEYISIGASGGGSKTIDKESAIRDNAFIKQRPIYSRPRIVGFVDPFKVLGDPGHREG